MSSSPLPGALLSGDSASASAPPHLRVHTLYQEQMKKTNLHIEPGLFHFQMYPALLSPVLLGLAQRPGASVLDLGSSPTDPAYKGLLQPADSTAACCGPVLPEGVQDCMRKATKPPVSQHGPRVFPAALGVERNHVAHEQEN